MIYVMSDIHGNYDKYNKMLKKISFGESDTLYILGDIVDRGKDGTKILLDVAERKNVVFLRGNHDQQAAILLSNLYRLDEEDCPKELIGVYRIWFSDGGDKTLTEYLKLSEEDRQTVMGVLKSSIASKELEINGKRFLLAHTVPEAERLDEYENWSLEDYILGEPDYEVAYFKDKYIITGHTPTGLIDPASKGRIWKGNHHIAIDCGCGFGSALGCLCLDTMEEFYVDD